ncbi:MAG: extracellular solute-binding protein, partial [Candidatus Competibacteraceae bacterium]|nr:extracellular solute-binding protein [Candidatus Competibacteraceae bacterium]
MNKAKRLCAITCLAVVATWLTPVQAQPSAAQTAVEAAKQYSGSTINVVWPAGVGALGQKIFAAPLFEQLTGVKVNIVEAPPTDVYIKVVAEHRAGTGGFDVVSLVPSWLTDLSIAGIIEPLDALVDKYGFAAELQGIEPAYRNNWMTHGGKIMAIPDDGDVLLLFYRKDLFNDPANKEAFKAKYGYELAVPTTWEQFSDIGWFFTNTYQPDLYGASVIHRSGLMQYF